MNAVEYDKRLKKEIKRLSDTMAVSNRRYTSHGYMCIDIYWKERGAFWVEQEGTKFYAFSPDWTEWEPGPITRDAINTIVDLIIEERQKEMY